MRPLDLLTGAIDPAIALLQRPDVAGIVPSAPGRLWVMTTAGQESRWIDRRQVGGPARSFWQFEQAGGVSDVLTRAAPKMRAVCGELFIPFNSAAIFEAMAWHDVLAACMARLLLWIDPAPLPDVADVNGGWAYYLRCWRPGMPHHETWPIRHQQARYAIALAAAN